jgi:MFS family permease
VAAIACYAMTLAPIVWVVISEIFPNKIRGMAMAAATFSLWTACFVLTYTFPLLNNRLGVYGTFWLYGIICLLGFCFIKKQLPETKGKSLEEIEKIIVNEYGKKKSYFRRMQLEKKKKIPSFSKREYIREVAERFTLILSAKK